jgi:multiple sugar transport system permease protein
MSQSQVKGKKKISIGRIIAYLFAILVAVVSFFPFFSMLISSTHTPYDIVTKLHFLPGKAFMTNYTRLTENVNIWRGFGNSLFVATLSVVITVYFSLMTAYGFSKFRFKGRNFLFGVVLVTMMLPGQLGILGSFRLFTNIKLLDTYWPMLIPGVANCGAVFFLKQFLDGGLPNEVIESAIIDGAGELKIYHSIVMPLARPAIVTQAIMSFIGSWNNYMTPLIMLRSKQKFTLPVLIASVGDAMHAEYGAYFVGMLITVIPLIILFIFTSRIIMEEISIGAAVKG